MIYRICTYQVSEPNEPELRDVIEFELTLVRPDSDSVFAILEAYREEGRLRDKSRMAKLYDTLEVLDDARDQNASFARIAMLESERADRAKSVREDVIRFAIQFLDAGSYDTISDLEPSILDRSDVKTLADSL